MTFQPNEIVQEITGENNQASKVVTDKAAYEADMVLIAAGVRPNTSWLDGIINLDDRGLIEIDDYLQTSDSNRSEEHTSELQSRGHLVCRLLLEKKKMI